MTYFQVAVYRISQFAGATQFKTALGGIDVRVYAVPGPAKILFSAFWNLQTSPEERPSRSAG